MPVPGELSDTTPVAAFHSPQPGSMKEMLSRLQECFAAIESETIKICKSDGRHDKSVPGSIGLAITGVQISGLRKPSVGTMIETCFWRWRRRFPPPAPPPSPHAPWFAAAICWVLCALLPADSASTAQGIMPCGPAYLSGQLDVGDEIVSIDDNEARFDSSPPSPSPSPLLPSPPP